MCRYAELQAAALPHSRAMRCAQVLAVPFHEWAVLPDELSAKQRYVTIKLEELIGEPLPCSYVRSAAALAAGGTFGSREA
jgi:hypothetical protein